MDLCLCLRWWGVLVAFLNRSTFPLHLKGSMLVQYVCYVCVECYLPFFLSCYCTPRMLAIPNHLYSAVYNDELLNALNGFMSFSVMTRGTGCFAELVNSNTESSLWGQWIGCLVISWSFELGSNINARIYLYSLNPALKNQAGVFRCSRKEGI
jgi:hypothetical protein